MILTIFFSDDSSDSVVMEVEAERDRVTAIDTSAILASRSTSGVTITPDWKAEKKLNKETFGVAGNMRFRVGLSRNDKVRPMTFKKKAIAFFFIWLSMTSSATAEKKSFKCMVIASILISLSLKSYQYVH